MVAVMAFLARYNYLYRIGALWPMGINALLRFAVAPPLSLLRSC